MSQIRVGTTILAADIGGTHLNLALLSRKAAGFDLVRKASCATQRESSLLEPVQRFLQACFPKKPDLACISGAGPVQGRQIHLTNVPWNIDGDVLADGLGIPVKVINDFTAIAHGVLLLDPTDRRQVCTLPHSDGSRPALDPEGTILIVGAGTGLGVAYVVRSGGEARVMPSEGGHIGLPVLGDETAELWRYLRSGFPGPPGAEAAVSGPGIANLFSFLADRQEKTDQALFASILALPKTERASVISTHADTDPLCRRTMDLFVDLYARVCAELSAVFLPTGGVFLAGGIAAKNEAHFLQENRFMASFEANYREHLDVITKNTPVHIVRDYDISLYGAARAGCEPGEIP